MNTVFFALFLSILGGLEDLPERLYWNGAKMRFDGEMNFEAAQDWYPENHLRFSHFTPCATLNLMSFYNLPLHMVIILRCIISKKMISCFIILEFKPD